MKYTYILMISGSLFLACKNEKVSSFQTDRSINEIKIEYGELDDWLCDKHEDVTVCHPNDWELTMLNKSELYYNFGSDENEYLIVLKYPVLANQKIENYLRHLFHEMKKDSLERVKDYALNKLTFLDGSVSYYAEYDMIVDSLPYKAYGIYTTFNVISMILH